mmetsp:Transcript_4322/g.4088  ORF Transcript_4322/g.4088 Transcript_4322/m.4088 type:complete len:92 (-) Transcript_4322:646-921(-)
MPHNLKDSESQKVLENMFFELMRRFNQGATLPLLHPIEDMEIEGKDMEKLCKKKEGILRELEDSKFQNITTTHEGMFVEKREIKESVRELE